MLNKWNFIIHEEYSDKHLIYTFLALSIRYPSLRYYFKKKESKWKQFVARKIDAAEISILYSNNQLSNDDLYKEILITKPPLFKIAIEFKENVTIVTLFIHSLISTTIDRQQFTKDFFNLYESKYPIWKKEDFPMLKQVPEPIISNLPFEIEDAYPLSSMQLGMIASTLSSKQKNNFRRVTPYAFIDNQFDLNLFKRALLLMQQKHEMLRVTYIKRYICQAILRNAYLNIYYKNIASFSKAEQKKIINKHILQEEGLNKKKIKLFNISLFKLENNLYQLLIFNHMSIMDGWSMSLFRDELFSTYSLLHKDCNTSLKKLECSYKDFIKRQQKTLKDRNASLFWANKIKKVSSPILVSLDGDDYCDNYSEWIDLSLISRMEKISKLIKVSMKDIFLTGFMFVLHNFFHRNKVTIGLLTNCRPAIIDAEKVIGCFINIVPLSIDFSKATDFFDAILMVKNKSIELKQYDNYPVGKICSIVFSYVNLKDLEDISTHVKFVSSPIESELEKENDFSVTIKNVNSDCLINIECSKNRYTKSTLELISQVFIFVLQNICNCSSIDLVINMLEQNKNYAELIQIQELEWKNA